MIALIAIESREMKVGIGPSIKHLVTEMDAKAIINDVLPYIKEKKYYKVAQDLIEDFNYYYNLRKDSKKDSFPYDKVIFGVITVLFVGGFITLIVCACKKKYPRRDSDSDSDIISSSGGLFSSSNDNYSSNNFSSGGGTLGGASASW